LKSKMNPNGMKGCFAILAALCAAVFCAASASAAIPKNGAIAVIVDGAEPQHIASTESIMVQQLIANGYKIVDEKKMAQIRRNKAARLALEGNVDAIMKLSSQYGISTVITARAQAGQPIVNEFKLYTGTASMAVMATASNGTRLYADTVSGKQVGYTPDEAAQKSLEAAVKLAVEKMTQ